MNRANKLVVKIAIIGLLTPTANMHAMEAPTLSPEEQKTLNMRLWNAADRGNLDTVLDALHHGAHIDYQNDNKNEYLHRGTTALMMASMRGHTDIVHTLIAAKANVNTKQEYPERDDKRSSTALLLATMFCPRSTRYEIAQALIEAKSDLDVQNFANSTALHYAADRCDTATVCSLIAAGAQLDIQNESQRTALHDAVTQAKAFGNSEKALALIAAHANPNLRDNFGCTPLICAASVKKPDIMIQLLKLNANPNILSNAGQTALKNAAFHGNNKTLRALLKAGANVDLVSLDNIDADTPLITAIRYGGLEVTQTLLAAGADLTIRDKKGFTALEIAKEDALIYAKPNIYHVIMVNEDKTRDLIRKKLAKQIMLKSDTAGYLLKQPLPIDPLVAIFAEYAIDPLSIPDVDIRARRAAETRAEWDRAEAQAGKENGEELKDNEE
jgi:ankyrin repeat protein